MMQFHYFSFVLPSRKVECFESPFYLSHSLALYLFINLRFYLSVFNPFSSLFKFTFIRTLFLKLPLSVSLISFYGPVFPVNSTKFR